MPAKIVSHCWMRRYELVAYGQSALRQQRSNVIGRIKGIVIFFLTKFPATLSKQVARQVVPVCPSQ